MLELDVGNIEKIGPVSAITSSVDGVESMQVLLQQIFAWPALQSDRSFLSVLPIAAGVFFFGHFAVRGFPFIVAGK